LGGVHGGQHSENSGTRIQLALGWLGLGVAGAAIQQGQRQKECDRKKDPIA